jgi:cystathionine beta-lyase family protein involved in aluminum resistance
MNEISNRARELVWEAERALDSVFHRVDAIEMATQQRVLSAFWDENVSTRHFAPTNGYGYDDIGRDTLDRVFAKAVQAEAALVASAVRQRDARDFYRARRVGRAGRYDPLDHGEPYDTLVEAIGCRGDAPNSLKRMGVHFRAIDLLPDGTIDRTRIRAETGETVRVVFAQRSRGYAWREAFSMEALEEAFKLAHEAFPDAVILVDNCYGEFVEASEPTTHGADLIAGSLIKNPGGGLAPTGGYVAGKKPLVDRIAQRLTVPGMGGEVGSYAGDYRPFYQGLFLAPHVTVQCVKSAALFARMFELLGFTTMPESKAPRSDIIQAVQFHNAESLVRFCRSIQKAAPVDSFVSPEPWDMPGYEDPVVMAAGTFVQGATTELSADGPIREPYTAYVQGALTYAHARIAAMLACDALLED